LSAQTHVLPETRKSSHTIKNTENSINSTEVRTPDKPICLLIGQIVAKTNTDTTYNLIFMQSIRQYVNHAHRRSFLSKGNLAQRPVNQQAQAYIILYFSY